jgi:hypothetical protein
MLDESNFTKRYRDFTCKMIVKLFVTKLVHVRLCKATSQYDSLYQFNV